MPIPQPPFQSMTADKNGRFNPVWVQWFQQVQQQLNAGTGNVIDGGTPSSIYGGSVSYISGGTVGNR